MGLAGVSGTKSVPQQKKHRARPLEESRGLDYPKGGSEAIVQVGDSFLARRPILFLLFLFVPWMCCIALLLPSFIIQSLFKLSVLLSGFATWRFRTRTEKESLASIPLARPNHVSIGGGTR